MDEIFRTIDIIFEAQKKARHRNDYNTLMVNAEALLERVPSLINYSIEKEKEYRKFEAKIANEKDETGKQRSGSFAETQAKATESYTEWQKAKLFMELIYEMVALSKKLATGVNQEYVSSN